MEISPNPNYKYTLVGQQGWICPRCGRVYGPNFFECSYCNNQITEVSTTSKDSSGYVVKDDDYTYADSITTRSYGDREIIKLNDDCAQTKEKYYKDIVDCCDYAADKIKYLLNRNDISIEDKDVLIEITDYYLYLSESDIGEDLDRLKKIVEKLDKHNKKLNVLYLKYTGLN